MKWNRLYHLNEKFPHPNINIEIGNTYHSEFIEAFPEIKLLIKKWANTNLDTLNCENIEKYIRNDAIPHIYSTHVSEDCDSGDKPLSQSEFLQLFGLKNVSNSTVW